MCLQPPSPGCLLGAAGPFWGKRIWERLVDYPKRAPAWEREPAWILGKTALWDFNKFFFLFFFLRFPEPRSSASERGAAGRCLCRVNTCSLFLLSSGSGHSSRASPGGRWRGEGAAWNPALLPVDIPGPAGGSAPSLRLLLQPLLPGSSRAFPALFSSPGCSRGSGGAGRGWHRPCPPGEPLNRLGMRNKSLVCRFPKLQMNVPCCLPGQHLRNFPSAPSECENWDGKPGCQKETSTELGELGAGQAQPCPVPPSASSGRAEPLKSLGIRAIPAIPQLSWFSKGREQAGICWAVSSLPRSGALLIKQEM